MLLWMIQPLSVWEDMQQAGSLYLGPDQVEGFDDFADSYQWLRSQMWSRLADYKGHDLWYARFEPRPYWLDIGDVGQPHVLLNVEVPDDKVVLSSNSGLCHLLNRCYLPVDLSDSEDWDAKLSEANVDELVWPLPEPWNSKLIDSWQRMFEVTDADVMGDYGPDPDVDAGFEELRLEYVKKCIVLERTR